VHQRVVSELAGGHPGIALAEREEAESSAAWRPDDAAASKSIDAGYQASTSSAFRLCKGELRLEDPGALAATAANGSNILQVAPPRAADDTGAGIAIAAELLRRVAMPRDDSETSADRIPDDLAQLGSTLRQVAPGLCTLLRGMTQLDRSTGTNMPSHRAQPEWPCPMQWCPQCATGATCAAGSDACQQVYLAHNGYTTSAAVQEPHGEADMTEEPMQRRPVWPRHRPDIHPEYLAEQFSIESSEVDSSATTLSPEHGDDSGSQSFNLPELPFGFALPLTDSLAAETLRAWSLAEVEMQMDETAHGKRLNKPEHSTIPEAGAMVLDPALATAILRQGAPVKEMLLPFTSDITGRYVMPLQGHGHWSTLHVLIIRQDGHTSAHIRHFDSDPGKHDSLAKHIADIIILHCGNRNGDFYQHPVPLQQDPEACGLHMLLQCHAAVRGIPPSAITAGLVAGMMAQLRDSEQRRSGSDDGETEGHLPPALRHSSPARSSSSAHTTKRAKHEAVPDPCVVTVTAHMPAGDYFRVPAPFFTRCYLPGDSVGLIYDAVDEPLHGITGTLSTNSDGRRTFGLYTIGTHIRLFPTDAVPAVPLLALVAEPVITGGAGGDGSTRQDSPDQGEDFGREILR
jgi:hypothetical protein